MTDYEKDMVAVLADYELPPEDEMFIENLSFTEHQPITKEQSTRLLGLYDDFVGYGRE